VCREVLLNEMVTKLCQSSIDSNNFGITLTITGASGFGKTYMALALCQHPEIKSKFTHGILFIELGPHSLHPGMHLSQIFRRLGVHYLQFDINNAQDQFSQLTKTYFQNLLVIIDDVWHVEDAEPIVKAFSSCKIVLTTRMKDFQDYIPTKEIVCVGQMEQSEAISLLTSDTPEFTKLHKNEEVLLEKLAFDLHLCPLLLSLIKVLLLYYVQRKYLSCMEAIQLIRSKVQDKDSRSVNVIPNEKNFRYTLKACIKLLFQSMSTHKLKLMLLYTGIGNSFPSNLLNFLWNTSEADAYGTFTLLLRCGLVQRKTVSQPPYNNGQSCLKIHTVICECIMDCLASQEVATLSPITKLGTYQLLVERVGYSLNECTFPTSVPAIYFLQHRLNCIEYCILLFYLQHIYLNILHDPHCAKVTLQEIQSATDTLENVLKYFPTFQEQVNALIDSCCKALEDAHKIYRTVRQTVQKCFTLNNYAEIEVTISKFISDYSVGIIAQEAVTVVKKIIPHLEGEQLQAIVSKIQALQKLTPKYHQITQITLPHIKLLIKEIQQINIALLTGPGSSEVDRAYKYYTSGECKKEKDLVLTYYHFKLIETSID